MTEIPLAQIDVDPKRNSRIGKPDVDNLKALITRSGWMSPVGVRKRGKRYELVFGYRRVAAAKALGWKKVPVQVLPDNDQLTERIVHFAENEGRQNLSPYERAQEMWRLSSLGLTQKELADIAGRSQPMVSLYLKIARDIIPEIQTEIARAPSAHRYDTLAELAQLSPEDQLDFWKGRDAPAEGRATEEIPEKVRLRRVSEVEALYRVVRTMYGKSHVAAKCLRYIMKNHRESLKQPPVALED